MICLVLTSDRALNSWQICWQFIILHFKRNSRSTCRLSSFPKNSKATLGGFFPIAKIFHKLHVLFCLLAGKILFVVFEKSFDMLVNNTPGFLNFKHVYRYVHLRFWHFAIIMFSGVFNSPKHLNSLSSSFCTFCFSCEL